MIEPTEGDDVCNTHSRQAFHDLVQLVGLTLYVDFPENASNCHGKDPQVPHGSTTHASSVSPVGRITALLAGNLTDLQTADATVVEMPFRYLGFIGESSIARRIAQRLGIAAYLFSVSAMDCGAPGINGGG